MKTGNTSSRITQGPCRMTEGVNELLWCHETDYFPEIKSGQAVPRNDSKICSDGTLL